MTNGGHVDDGDGGEGGREPTFCRLLYGNYSIIVWFLAIALFLYGVPT